MSLLPRYREYMEYERQLSRSTVAAYMSDLRTLDRFVQKPVAEITSDDLRSFMHITKEGIKTATLHRKMAGFSTFWKWLVLEHLATEVITDRVRLPKLQQRVPVWLSHHELALFVNTPAPGHNKRIRARNMMAWRFLAWFGLRRDELRKLLVGDVRLDDGVLIVRETKGKRDRVLPLPSRLVPELVEYIGTRPPDEYLFPSSAGRWWKRPYFYAAFYQHIKACGLEGRGITPHSLRHTFAVHLRLRGVSIEIVKELLGHRDIKTTLKYLQFGPDQFAQAMESHILNDLDAKAAKNQPPV